MEQTLAMNNESKDKKTLAMNNESKDKKTLPEIDSQAITYNLSITPDNRLKQHQLSLDTVYELEKAHRELYEKPKSTP